MANSKTKRDISLINNPNIIKRRKSQEIACESKANKNVYDFETLFELKQNLILPSKKKYNYNIIYY